MNTSRHLTYNKLAASLALTTAAYLVSLPVSASSVGIRIANNTATANLSLTPVNSKAQIDIGYLHGVGNKNVGTLGLHATGQTVLANLPTTAGVGFEAIAFSSHPLKGYGLGLGGFLKVNIPNVPGLSLEGDAHYAPNILTFNDADNIKDLRVQVNYRVIPNAEIFAGYHYLNAGIKNTPTLSLDAAPFIGMRMMF